MEYEYKIPDGKKVIIPCGHWNKYYRKCGKRIVTHTEAYITEERIVFHHVISPVGKMVFTLILPIIFVIGTLQGGVKETVTSILDVYRVKKRGKFISDIIWNNERGATEWKKAMKMIEAI